jgi:outer membrane protein TolC
VPRFRYGGVFSGRLTLLDFGRTALGVQAANAAIGAERANMTRAKVELVQRAREAYLRWMEAHQTWQLAERDADVTAARTVSVRELIAEGVRPATDATLSAYDEQVARLRQNRAARAAEAALEALGEIVQTKLPEQSVPDLDVLEVDPAPENDAQSTPPPPPTGDGLTQERDATLGALDLSRQAALSAARAADRAGAPVLDGAMEAGVQGQNTTLFPIYRASVTLTVPIWDGGARTAQAAVHRAEAEELDAQHRVRQLAFDREEQAADRRSRAAVESLRLSLELLAIAEQMLTQAEDHYRSGSDTLERVLAAQRSLVQARREVLTARVETARTRLELRPIKLD